MTTEELSERILDGSFPTDISHEDLSDDELEHYGVLGMKWGVRKDRRREGETDEEYQNRIKRQNTERDQAHELKLKKAELRAKSQDQKRLLRSQQRIAKAQNSIRKKELKLQKDRENAQKRSQEEQAKARKKELKLQKDRENAQRKQQKEEAKAKEKQRQEELKSKEKRRKEENKKKTKSKIDRDVTSLTDQELQDIITRIEREQKYSNLTRGLGGRMIDKGKSIVGNTASNLATEYVKKYGTDAVNRMIENYKKNTKK